MKVIKNYIYNAIYQLFKMLIPIITIPYLSRVLGPKEIGINSYTFTIIQYFVLISDLGITIYGDREIAYVKNNRYKLTQTFWGIMILQAITVIISYFFFFIFLAFTQRYYTYYLAQSILIVANAFDISWFFMGVENFKITVMRNFIVRVLVLLFIFMFVKSQSDLLLYIVLYTCSFLIGNMTLFPSLRKYINLPDFKSLRVFKHFYPALILFIPEVASQIYMLFNKNILGIVSNTSNVGFFDQSDKIIQTILTVITATGTVMLPHVAHAFANREFNKTKKYLYDSFSLVTALSLPCTLGIIGISNKFIPLFLSNKFSVVINLINIESIVCIFISWSNVLGIQYLLPTHQTKSYTFSIILGAIVNMIMDIPLIIIFNTVGAIISYILSEFTVTFFQLLSIRNQISYKKLFASIYKYIVSSILMYIIIYIINVTTPCSWLMVLCETCIGIIMYVLFIYILHSNVFSIIRNMLSKGNEY